MLRGGGYPVRPPVTCIDISHVAEKTLNFQVGRVIGGLPSPVRLLDVPLTRDKGGGVRPPHHYKTPAKKLRIILCQLNTGLV